ncbi:MAG: glutamate--tRNA ligase, partial [Actinobacteria bacterium]|nr:glutamate--tRNA ligase [Actinomycetota bacterium]
MIVRTRFEPAPTGSLHVGHALAAAFNWLYARKHNGAFVLRFADTDRERTVEGGAEHALGDLDWLGLGWDEGPFKQSERIPLYQEAVEKLLASGNAYRCFCTPEELDARRKQALKEGRPPGYDGRCRNLSEAQAREFQAEGRTPAVRFKMPAGSTTTTDLVRGEITFEHTSSDDVVIMRADGWPLYGLAAPYDDLTMKITHVLRGEDIFPNTARQIRLIEALGGEPPAYGHFPLLVGADRAKLSKRHGATAVREYRDMGFLPEVMINYLAILDWSVGDGMTERFTIEQLISSFEPSGITRNPSAFDLQKLTAFNGERIRELAVDDFVARAEPYLRDIMYERATLLRIVPLVQERVHRLDEVPGQVRFLFEDAEPDEKAAALIGRAQH